MDVTVDTPPTMTLPWRGGSPERSRRRSQGQRRGDAAGDGRRDFGEIGPRPGSLPALRVGGTEPKKFESAGGDMTRLPYIHSSEWAPDREPTLKTGTAALTWGARAPRQARPGTGSAVLPRRRHHMTRRARRQEKESEGTRKEAAEILSDDENLEKDGSRERSEGEARETLGKPAARSARPSRIWRKNQA